MIVIGMGGAPLRLWSVLQAPPTVFYCWPIWSETNGIKKKLLFLECFKKILFILARGFEKDSSSTLTSKATGTKRNVIALLSDDAVVLPGPTEPLPAHPSKHPPNSILLLRTPFIWEGLWGTWEDLWQNWDSLRGSWEVLRKLRECYRELGGLWRGGEGEKRLKMI